MLQRNLAPREHIIHTHTNPSSATAKTCGSRDIDLPAQIHGVIVQTRGFGGIVAGRREDAVGQGVAGQPGDGAGAAAGGAEEGVDAAVGGAAGDGGCLDTVSRCRNEGFFVDVCCG